jgi:hypothetical protein
MEAQSLILGVVIVALSLLFVVWPFVGARREEDTAAASGTTLERLESQRDAIYATIRDLDFDYETGKLLEADYQAQRAEWVERGVDVLKAIDSMQQQVDVPVSAEAALPADSVDPDDIEAQIEAAVAARRRTV